MLLFVVDLVCPVGSSGYRRTYPLIYTGDMTLNILQALGKIFLLFGAGMLARRLGYLDERDIQRMTRLVIDFFFPALIFTSLVRNFQVERIGVLWPLPVIGLGVMMFNGLLGLLLARLFFRDAATDVRRTFQHMCVSNNYGFIPIILVSSILGEASLANLFFHNIGTTLGHWTIGVAVLAGFTVANITRVLTSPPLIACVLGVLGAFVGVADWMPEILSDFLTTAGGVATPFALFIIGASLLGAKVRALIGPIAVIAGVRLVLLPLADFGVLVSIPGLQPEVIRVALVVCAMPVAFTSAILARRYNASGDYAAGAAIATTVLSVGTVPVLLSLLLPLAG